VYQVVALALIVGVAWFLAHNTLVNMRVRGIQSGFDFLQQAAGFDIGESLLAYDSEQPYWRAFLVGVSNTLRVAVVGILLATVIGTLLGVGRFSRNALVRGLCLGYVEVFRNIPVLLQLLLWYVVLTEILPNPANAMHLGSYYLSKGGLNFPVPVWGHAWGWVLGGLALAAAAVWAYLRWARAQFESTGHLRSQFWLPVGLLALGVLLGWWLGGAPTQVNFPVQGEFAIENGGAVTPEFLAVLLGLTVYTASFIAEVVRGGIQSVPRGQSEAAAALGLSRGQEMRLVMLPQALRVMIPPLTNQYLNLTKNSSLAVAIGYPDVVSIANTSLNQTGRAVECISIVMLVYLSTSVATSLLMNWYNAKAAIRER
jgi:general L-amino acid transport system permease protein